MVVHMRWCTTTVNIQHSTWDTRARRVASRYRLTGVGQTMAWHPNGNLVAVGSSNETLTIFDVRGGELHKPLHVVEKIVEVCGLLITARVYDVFTIPPKFCPPPSCS